MPEKSLRIIVAVAILQTVTSPAREHPSLVSFWNDLPRDGKFLLSTVAIETLGTGLVLPFGFIYLHEVRGFTIETAGSLLAVPAIAGMAVVGPAGAFIDRLGARRIILAGMAAQMLGNVLLAFSATPLMSALSMGLLGAAGGIFWPGFNAMIGAVVPSGIRQRYFGINFTLVNLGIGLGGVLAGSIVNVHRPGTFVAIYLGNAFSFLAPLAVLVGPLRHVSGKVDHPVSELDGSPVQTSYLDVLRDKAMVPVAALTFLSAFVGYAQTEAGFTAYARLVGGVSTRTIGYAFAANTVTIVLLQLLVLQRIEGRRRTRVILVLSALWSVSWLMTGFSGLLPGTPSADALIIGGMAMFALGETLLQPTIPAITNDLSPDHLRGRYNAVMAGAFQLAAITGPVVTGVMLGARFNVEFIGLLILGCALMSLIAIAVEHRISAQANGITTATAELSRA
jgi:MFS family permease